MQYKQTVLNYAGHDAAPTKILNQFLPKLVDEELALVTAFNNQQ